MANIDTDLRCYLTNSGIAAENNAIQLGRKLPIKEMVFGSGLLPDSEDPRNQTAMLNEELAVPCVMVTHDDNVTLLTFKGDIPVDVGGFNINEVAIRLEDGTIYGYARGAGDYKPTPEQGATESIRYVVDMYTTNAAVLECKVDLSSVYSDYEDLEAVRVEAASNLQSHIADSDPHAQYLKTDILVGLVVPDSTALATRALAFIADGSAYQVAHYPKLMGKVQGTAIMVSQSLIDANPEQYAACYGISDDGLTFTVPNYSLRPHLAVAGSFGAVGSTIEDQIQNITGKVTNTGGTEGITFTAPSQGVSEGALKLEDEFSANCGGNLSNVSSKTLSFDASLSARTGSYTEVNSSFLNFYIIHGEVA